MKNENLPEISFCPFCGHRNPKLTCKRAGTYCRKGDAYQVLCSKCYARGPLFTYQYEEHGKPPAYNREAARQTMIRAIEAWNCGVEK